MAQITYSQLIARAKEEDIPIVAKRVGNLGYVANWVGAVSSLMALILWHHLAARNQINRVPTIDTTDPVHAKTTSVDMNGHSESAWPYISSPVRKRIV